MCVLVQGVKDLADQQHETQPTLILASASARRKQLLLASGIPFSIYVADIHEQPQEQETPRAYVQRNAREKALKIAQMQPKSFVLSADTIVVTMAGELLEKPRDAQHATHMLSLLSDRTHLVFTAYSLFQDSRELCTHIVETSVKFRKLSQAEVQSYIATGEPFDKAGGYGIQGPAMGFVESIEGSYTNVMGLPLSHVLVDLETHIGLKPFTQAPILI